MNWRRALHFAIAAGVPGRSLRVAVVVGTALNLINQADALFGGAVLNWWKLGLTYAMPYAVSTYGAVAFRMALEAERTTVTASVAASPIRRRSDRISRRG